MKRLVSPSHTWGFVRIGKDLPALIHEKRLNHTKHNSDMDRFVLCFWGYCLAVQFHLYNKPIIKLSSVPTYWGYHHGCIHRLPCGKLT